MQLTISSRAVSGLGRTLIAGAMLAGFAQAPLALAQDAEQQTARRTVRRSPKLYYLDRYDVSPPLREMKPLSRREREPREYEPIRSPRPPRPVSPAPDPLVLRPEAMRQESTPTPMFSATSGLSFDGVGEGLTGFIMQGAPPDTNGAVGATQYVQWVNEQFAVFDKTTGAKVLGPLQGSTLWQGFGGECEDDNDGDPIASYDKQANRWVLSQFAIQRTDGTDYFQCIAVSMTSDATGTYRRFAYNFSDLNDYGKFGTWADAYYMTFNMFTSAVGSYVGDKMCALDRNQMLSTSGVPGPIQCFDDANAFGILPSDLDGATAPPAGSPNFMLELGFPGPSLELRRFHVDWTTPANSTISATPISIPVASFNDACGGGTCIPQAGTANQLDSLAGRLMYRLAYRNFGDHESLVVTHSVSNGSTPAAVRWYEIRDPNGTPTVFQQGTFSPDATSRWMGSIAQDKRGNMLLGYSTSSASLHPGIRLTGRLVSDASGSMQSENTLLTGVGSQTGGLTRWGDYSAMTIDPTDDCTFWYTTEYLKTTGSFNWSTRIASFQFPTCDPAPSTVQFSAATFAGSEASGKAVLTVTRTSGVVAATVDYATSDGSATSGADYTATTGTLSFAAGVTTQTITIPVVNDTIQEGDETFTVTLTNPTGTAVSLGAPAVATVTIADNDVAGSIQFGASSYTVSEASPSVTITVTRTGGTASGATVFYSTSDGTATQPQDYVSTSGTLTFGASQASQTFSVPIVNDTIHEPTETIGLTLSAPGGGASLGARQESVINITDNDPAGTVQFSAATYGVSEGVGTAVVTVTRTAGTASGVSVDYHTSDGTATAPADYTAESGTLVFGPGQTSTTIGIPIVDDGIGEANETVNLSLTNPQGGATLGTHPTAVLTILENESVVQFSAANYTVAESGVKATITVKRSGLLTGTTSVDYTTIDGTATAGSDYTTASGTLTFGPNVTTKTFTVPIANDTAAEPAETVLLKLTAGAGATLGPVHTSVLTITDNDSSVFAFGAATYGVTEGTPAVTITVKRTGFMMKAATVNYATSDGSATAGSDYVATTGQLSFASGVASKTFTIPIVDDGVAETDETFFVSLSSTGEDPVGTPGTTVVTIKDNEPVFSFAASSYTATEASGKVVLTVKRSGLLTIPAAVDFSTSDGSATSASDYTSTSGTLSFAANVASKTITVTLTKDATVEDTENFTVNLAGAVPGRVAGGPATVFITDNPQMFNFSMANYTVAESAGQATITVKRVGPLTGTATVNYATSDGSAQAPGDYALTSGTLTFAPNVASKTFTVPVVEDTLQEGPEAVQLALSSPSAGVSLGAQSTSTLTITDDDTAGSIQYGAVGYAGTEGETITVTVTRTGGTASNVDLDVVPIGGTAQIAIDYFPPPSHLTFAAGETTKTVTISTVDNFAATGTKTIVLGFNNVGGGATQGAQNTTTVYIADND